MAKGKRRQGRRRRSRSTAAPASLSAKQRSAFTDGAFSRSLRLEQLEDRRLLATFNVVNTNDNVPGSLRDAIERSNEFGDFDTIVFTGLAFENPQAIGTFGQLDITGPVNIVGPGASKLTILGAANRRVFLVDNGGDESTAGVTISGVNLVGNGAIAGDDEDGRGGAILNRENLTLDQVEISGFSAPNGGGAIFNETGNLQVNRSLIVDNTSGQGGGGIQNGVADQTDNLPQATLVSSTITGNTANGNPGEMGADTGYGGGVANFAGTVSILQSTIYGNYARVYGGGSATQGFDPELDDMGAPTVYEGNATTNIRSSIIVGNTVSDDMGGTIPDDVGSTGMTEGDEMNPAAPFEPQIDSLGYNLFGILTHPLTTAHLTVTLPPMGTGDMEMVDPKSVFIDNGDPLDPIAVLGDYGGDTRVFMPDPNKPGGLMVIDHGDPMIVSGAFDQRGRHFTRIFPDMGVVDIGAVEVQDGVFVVDSLLDESDGEYRDGDFSLREAVEFSEKNPNRDRIEFAASLRTEDDPNPFTLAPTIILTVGQEISITKGVDIQGPTFQLEVDGNSSSRIFNIDDLDGTNAIDVKIHDLTLTNGGGGVNRGGAIRNQETLLLNRLYFEGSSATLNGGALYVEAGDVTVDSSTFEANTAANNGGGIFVDSGAGSVEIINSTLSANIANNRGAGLANLGADTRVKHSTITLNNASTTRGSGIANLSGGLLTVYSSVIAGNLNTDIEFFGGQASDITSDGYNLVGLGNAIGVFIAAGDDNTVLDPKLAALAFTGGPTPTHRILGDSLALDAGELGGAGFPLFDQRGPSQFVRVFDGDLDGTAQIDIGTYELQEVTYTVDSPLDENDGDTTLGNLSLREAIEIANASISPLPESIVFDAMIAGSTISPSPNGLAPFTTPDIKITGPVNIIGDTITIDGSGLPNGTPMFTVDDGDDLTMSAVSFDGFFFISGKGRAISSKEDIAITSVFATGNNGVFDHTLGTLTLKTSTLTGNSTPASGGVIAVTDGNLIVEGNPVGYGYTLLTGNDTTDSGSNGGAISFSDSTTTGMMLSLSKVLIAGNRAPAGEADGGGIFISGNGSTTGARTEASLQDSVLSGNTTTGSNSEGAGIFVKDTDLTLTGTIISLNKSFGTNSKGAGIYVSGGSLTVDNSATNNSLITQNRTYGNYASGAGIANVGGDVTLNQTTISRNVTAGNSAHGAGIYSTGGNLTLNGTTVSQNSSAMSGIKGGGIYSQTNLLGTQKTSIINSTISGNSTEFRGGGVYNAGGLLEIKYSTITNNSVPYFGNGGGVASLGDAGTTRTEVRSSIIAGNLTTFPDTPQLPNPPNSDVDAVNGLTNSFVSLDYNVIGKGLPLALNAFDPLLNPLLMGDQFDVDDPGLEPLSTDFINGSPTATHALKSGSPAINAGDPNAVAGVGNVPAFDQRGMPNARVAIGRIDVGAFESNLSPVMAFAPTDFNEDGFVNGFDFLSWQRGFGTPSAMKADGDSNGDANVDGTDLTNWQSDFGTGAAAPIPSVLDPADFDDNGAVNGTDFLRWQRGFGKPNASKIDGDSDNDQDVDGADLANWQLAFSTSIDNPALAAALSPEAASVFAQAAAVAALMSVEEVTSPSTLQWVAAQGSRPVELISDVALAAVDSSLAAPQIGSTQEVTTRAVLDAGAAILRSQSNSFADSTRTANYAEDEEVDLTTTAARDVLLTSFDSPEGDSDYGDIVTVRSQSADAAEDKFAAEDRLFDLLGRDVF